MMQPTHQFLADDGDYDDNESNETSMPESEKDWNPFGEEAQQEDEECYEEEMEDDLDATWKDEQKNKVDAILSRRRRGDEMKDASTASGSSDMDTSSAAMGAGSSRRRAERRHGTNSGSGTLGLKRVDSSEEERRLRRERRRAKRSASPTRNRSSSSGGSPRPRPARLASSNRSGSSRNLTWSRNGSSRNLSSSARSGSSRNLVSTRSGSSRNLSKGSKPRSTTPPQRSKSQNRNLGLDALETHDTKRGALGRTKSSAHSRSNRNLRGGLSASRCTNTSPKGNLPRTSSSPMLQHNKLKPGFRLNDPSEIVAVRTTRRAKRSQSPRKGLSASTTSRPTSRKASCVTLLRSSSTSRLPLGLPTATSSKQENNVGPLCAQ